MEVEVGLVVKLSRTEVGSLMLSRVEVEFGLVVNCCGNVQVDLHKVQQDCCERPPPPSPQIQRVRASPPPVF